MQTVILIFGYMPPGCFHPSEVLLIHKLLVGSVKFNRLRWLPGTDQFLVLFLIFIIHTRSTGSKTDLIADLPLVLFG